MGLAEIKDCCNAASVLAEQGRLVEALELFSQATRRCEDELGADHHAYALCLTGRGAVLADLGRLDEAHLVFAEAIERARRFDDSRFEERVTVTTHAIWFHRDSGDLDKARALWDEALAVLSANLGEDHPRALLSARRSPLDVLDEGFRPYVTPWHQRLLP